MPDTKGAAKRCRQSLRIRARNRSVRSQVRTSVKTFESAVEKNDRAGAEIKYRDFVKLIDTAAQKGLYHPNTSARKKSRMYKRLASLG